MRIALVKSKLLPRIVRSHWLYSITALSLSSQPPPPMLSSSSDSAPPQLSKRLSTMVTFLAWCTHSLKNSRLVKRTCRTVQLSATLMPPPARSRFLSSAEPGVRKSHTSPGRVTGMVGSGAPMPVRQLPLTVRSETRLLLPGWAGSLSFSLYRMIDPKLIQ